MKKKKAPLKTDKAYLSFIREVKRSISQSSYQAAKLVNKELLLLYLKTGRLLDERVTSEGWGQKVIQRISEDIQHAFPGLKGFSARNLFYMQQLYRHYAPQLVQTVSALIEAPGRKSKKIHPELVQTLSALIPEPVFAEAFFSVGFSHHVLILSRCANADERSFYLIQAAKNHWSYRVLEHHIDSRLFRRRRIQNNFHKSLPYTMRQPAASAFKDEYLLNFININEDDHESVLEKKLVDNLRQFLLSLGSEFAFLGNQYRLIVDEEEFFVDLLFYHRKLSCLVAIELKTGKFKPEYVGKMNFYLSALDEQVRMDHENPSVGIILCKEKSRNIVEYAFRDTTKAIGVATIRYSAELPGKLKKHFPSTQALKKLLR